MTFLLKVSGIGLLLVGLLTWLLIRSFEPHDADLVEMRHALDALALNDSLLHGNILKARTGLLLNYDPLVHDIETMRASILRLKSYDWDTPEPMRSARRKASSNSSRPTTRSCGTRSPTSTS